MRPNVETPASELRGGRERIERLLGNFRESSFPVGSP
jgi:hypothetical protein